MSSSFIRFLVGLILISVAQHPIHAAEGIADGVDAIDLPVGVRAVWNADRAFRESTPTRERICLNGLWRWQPASSAVAPESLPSSNWGYFKVPGSWPGITDYMQKDSQTIFAHPAWTNFRPATLTAAWYDRTVDVPTAWAGRQIELSIEQLNSLAIIFVDGVKRGEVRFPGGTVELSDFLKPGTRQRLSIWAVALPLRGVLLSYTDSNSAREVKGRVERRGLCGDVFLICQPQGPRLTDVKVETSVRRGSVRFTATLAGPVPKPGFTLSAWVAKGGTPVREFKGPSGLTNDPTTGRVTFEAAWQPAETWDLHTPTNQFTATVTLRDATAGIVDVAFPTRFGFREFWIDGRDFRFNGSRLFLSAVPLDNAQVGAAWASYAGARESLQRLKNIGINFVYTHNYGCEPGTHLAFEEILQAADDVGMLVALSQPHFSHYEWKSPEADRTNSFARHAEYYTRVAGNHPSVVAYAMSHNATGYEEDMNPDMIDGIQAPRDRWSQNNAKLALRAEAIVRRFDDGRIIYHHASGNLGSMHVMNFYPNFVPRQELSDWFGHWATTGVKPVFTCEYGAPFTWDWTMYRGWYKGQREWGSAEVPWEYCLTEWNAQFLGDRAYPIGPAETANLRWEAQQFRAGRVWHRWDYPHPVGSDVFAEQFPIMARYIEDNWRAFRTWGVSGISPWEHEQYWKRRPGVDRKRRDLPVNWDQLQRPGFSADFENERYERWDLAFGRGDWISTEAATALVRNNQPLLAYLGGKTSAFTSKDHNFLPGETVEKQIIVINNSRERVSAQIDWSSTTQPRAQGNQIVQIETGEQIRIPVRLPLDATHSPGQYELSARIRFANGTVQDDKLPIDVLPRPTPPTIKRDRRLLVFDPSEETARLLRRLDLSFQSIDSNVEARAEDVLIIGKNALTVHGRIPSVAGVRNGLRVVLFEQTADALEKRLGFRVAEYGLREVFPRVPDHPILTSLHAAHWHDWRGEASLLPAQLQYEIRPRYGPTVRWCDLPVPRLWRCGNRGNVASVLIEKPARGDFLPILDGGFGLQYSPLLECHEGRGLVLFCQLDVTGRSETEPVADVIVRNLIAYADAWQPATASRAFYTGDDSVRRRIEAVGFDVQDFTEGTSPTNGLLIVGPHSTLPPTTRSRIEAWRRSGGRLLGLGLEDGSDVARAFPFSFRVREHIATSFAPPPFISTLRGIGPADLHNRDPRNFATIVPGPDTLTLGDGLLATASGDRVTISQFVPWQFAPGSPMNLKRTQRRAYVVLARLLGNQGVASTTPLLGRLNTPLDVARVEKRFIEGIYLDTPEEWDDPYRFFRW